MRVTVFRSTSSLSGKLSILLARREKKVAFGKNYNLSRSMDHGIQNSCAVELVSFFLIIIAFPLNILHQNQNSWVASKTFGPDVATCKVHIEISSYVFRTQNSCQKLVVS